ncbi:MAG: sugar nucleotide-binding protein [Candidatus Omnitrophica bacterium]|nr:sugar nucleotide-binding protein [Candidatus Omnitrophota bacterium]
MKILIFGRDGMLGQMFYSYLDSKKEEVFGTQRENKDQLFYFNIQKPIPEIDIFLNIPSDLDYIINCIGVNQLERRAPDSFRLGFYVNAFFPGYLCEFCRVNSIKMIHISTDAVFQESLTARYEDDLCDGFGDYAISKILGEISGPDMLNVRCSIIGSEAKRSPNLLSWFLSQDDGGAIPGYINHIWNGVTTLQLAKFIYRLIKTNEFSKIVAKTNVIHFSPNKPLSKFDLLVLFKDIYAKNICINPVKAKDGITRILHSNLDVINCCEFEKNKDIKDEIIEMKDFFELIHKNKE